MPGLGLVCASAKPPTGGRTASELIFMAPLRAILTSYTSYWGLTQPATVPIAAFRRPFSGPKHPINRRPTIRLDVKRESRVSWSPGVSQLTLSRIGDTLTSNVRYFRCGEHPGCTSSSDSKTFLCGKLQIRRGFVRPATHDRTRLLEAITPTLNEDSNRDQPQHRNSLWHPRRKPAPAGRWPERGHRHAFRLHRDRGSAQRRRPHRSRCSPITSTCSATDSPS